ncbi:MAG TPA: DUF1572 family protein [Gemmatimonadaceae bacterium]
MVSKDFVDEYARYRQIGERAMAQVPDEALNQVVAPDGNSIAMLVHHISGNLISRFTDFLHADGEKPSRHRDSEFEERVFTRGEVEAMWSAGWEVVEHEVGRLTDADLSSTVRIRGQPLTVHQALSRSVAHTAYHVGQIVLLSRMLASDDWRWISIPKGKSEEYNQNPTREKRPG